jgi:hypothetical protein
MIPLAKKYFQENPEAKYFYYSANVRVPNPALKPWLNEPREPWPDHHEVMNK